MTGENALILHVKYNSVSKKLYNFIQNWRTVWVGPEQHSAAVDLSHVFALNTALNQH